METVPKPKLSNTKNNLRPHPLTIALAICLYGASNAASADTTRISSVVFATDPAKVTALQNAVAAMRANDNAVNTSVDYYGSWQYWASIHGYLGAGPHAAGVAATWVPKQINLRCAGDALCISYYNHVKDTLVPADRFSANIWGTCQHGNLNFLPWHRLYLHFFERVLRKQSGNPDVNLPYWDYYNEKGSGGKGVALPSEVRGTASNPLYDQFRTPGLNDYSRAMYFGDASADQAFKFTDFTSFSNQLQSQPHGTMHCATGMGCKAPDIGLVPLSGLDAVFYMHHANIDRLWQCWLNRKANGQTIDLAWAKNNLGMPDSWYQTTFGFVDEDGNYVTRTIADIFTPGVIDTHYDQETNCATSIPSLTSGHTALAPAALTSSAATPMAFVPMVNLGGAVLKGKTMTIPLQASSGQTTLTAVPQIKGVQSGNALLTIENIDVQGDPEVSYRIYISSKHDPKRSVYLATLNYFGTLEEMPAGHQHSVSSHGKIGTLQYDIQNELTELELTSTADLTVRFVPHDFTDEPVKERLSKGHVTIGAIYLNRANGS